MADLNKEFIGGQRQERVAHGLGLWMVRNIWIGSRDTAVDDGFGELTYTPTAGAMVYLQQEH